MWERRDLKDRAKTAFHNNYWKCVIVGLILGLLTNAGAGGATAAGISAFFSIPANAAQTGFASNADALYYFMAGAAADAVLVIVLVVGVVLAVLKIFVFNLLEVGGCRFFCENSIAVYDTDQKAGISKILWGFDSGHWFNIVKIIFFRDIKTFLWNLLFIIPGIVKYYEYRMVPYILSEYPDMDSKDVFRQSREMMDGNKWAAFVLDLSFIGWLLLGAITLGLVNLFWTRPYEYATDAELYLTLRDEYRHQ